MASKIHVICNICGKDIELDRPTTGDSTIDQTLMRIATRIICNACGDERHEKSMRQSEAMRIMRLNDRISALIPPQFQDTQEDLLPDKSAHAKAMAWEYGPKGLLLYGSPRTGKTRTAWQIMRRECQFNRTVAGLRHSDFAFMAFRHPTKSDATKWFYLLAHCDLLFIDDLGQAKLSEKDEGLATEELLWEILEARWTNNLPCIFTTNLVGDKLSQRLSAIRKDGFVARLREFQTAIHFKGGSAITTPKHNQNAS